MSSKKPDKPAKLGDKKDISVMTEIKRIEDSIKTLTTNLNKLKTKFKTKNEGVKKE
ncbi:MAG: hypothetical protein H0X03_03250 [Nitrosopumilus sp.]|nr:hypothetical protein [Nitrosopumilus sp.]